MNTGFSGLRIAARRLLHRFILPGTVASALSAAANTAPAIEPIPDIVLAPGSGTVAVPVEVEDAETPRASLQVQVTGSPYASTELRADRWYVILGTGVSNAVLQVSVADPEGAVATVGVRVETLSPASLLRFSEIPPRQAWEGGPTLRIPFNVTYPAGATLRLSVRVSDPRWCGGPRAWFAVRRRRFKDRRPHWRRRTWTGTAMGTWT